MVGKLPIKLLWSNVMDYSPPIHVIYLDVVLATYRLLIGYLYIDRLIHSCIHLLTRIIGSCTFNDFSNCPTQLTILNRYILLLMKFYLLATNKLKFCYKVCMEMTNKSSKWTRHWDDQSATPYLRDGDRVIVYDNPRSIAIKVK